MKDAYEMFVSAWHTGAWVGCALFAFAMIFVLVVLINYQSIEEKGTGLRELNKMLADPNAIYPRKISIKFSQFAEQQFDRLLGNKWNDISTLHSSLAICAGVPLISALILWLYSGVPTYGIRSLFPTDAPAWARTVAGVSIVFTAGVTLFMQIRLRLLIEGKIDRANAAKSLRTMLLASFGCATALIPCIVLLNLSLLPVAALGILVPLFANPNIYPAFGVLAVVALPTFILASLDAGRYAAVLPIVFLVIFGGIANRRLATAVPANAFRLGWELILLNIVCIGIALFGLRGADVTRELRGVIHLGLMVPLFIFPTVYISNCLAQHLIAQLRTSQPINVKLTANSRVWREFAIALGATCAVTLLIPFAIKMAMMATNALTKLPNREGWIDSGQWTIYDSLWVYMVIGFATIPLLIYWIIVALSLLTITAPQKIREYLSKQALNPDLLTNPRARWRVSIGAALIEMFGSVIAVFSIAGIIKAFEYALPFLVRLAWPLPQ